MKYLPVLSRKSMIYEVEEVFSRKDSDSNDSIIVFTKTCKIHKLQTKAL